MPPKAPAITRVGKRPPAPSASAAAATVASIDKDTLKAAYLRNATSANLLDRMLEVLSSLDTLSNAELSTGTPVISLLPKDFVSELLKGEYITNPSNDVRTLVALCLGCILGGGAAAVLMRGFGAPVPADLFSDSKCLDVLKLICGTVCMLRTVAGQQTRSYIRRLIEKCASRHVLHSLLQRLAVGTDVDSPVASRGRGGTHDQTARAAEVDGAVESLFQAILHGIDGDDNSMVAQLASLLNDIVDVHRSLTTTQLNLLLTAVVPKTPTRTADGKTASLPTGIRIATAVLRRQADVLATAVCQEAVYSGVEAALEEIQQAELGDQDAGVQADRRNAMRKLGSSLEICIALCKVSTQLVSQMITLLQQHLESSNNDVRLVFIRSFSRIFTAVPEMTSEFTPAYHTFLSKFSDMRPQIRVEMVKYAKDAILVNPHVDPAWITLSPLLSNKLVDSDESVRRAAVTSVVDMALTVPKRVPNRLYEELAQRCKDKHQRVRQTAVEKLAKLYASTKLAWIPNAIFASAMISQGGDISLVESALVTMLPSPSAANAATAGVTPAQLANRKKQAKLGTTPLTKKDSFKFDFEGNDETNPLATPDPSLSKNTITAAFSILCGQLNNDSWQMLLALMRKKAQLRLTVRRLFEVRAAIKAKVNVEGNTDAAKRLISFLTTVCHCDSEWSSLFVERDDTLGKQLAVVCDPGCKDFFTAGEVQLLTKAKARTKGNIYTFLSENVCKRLYLPLSEADATELVSRINAQRSNVLDLAKVIASGSSSSSVEEAKKRHEREIGRIHGSMRALMAIGSFAPQLLYPTAVVALCRWIREDAAAARDVNGQGGGGAASSSSSSATTKKTDMTKAVAMSLTILEAVVTSHRDVTREQHTQAKKKERDVLDSELAEEEENIDDEDFDVPLPAEVLDSRKEIITAIGTLCVRSPSADIAKAAARCLTAMFLTSQQALKKLCDSIKQKLTMVVVQAGGVGDGEDQASIELPVQLVSWIKALTVLFTNAPSIASYAFSDVIVDSLQQLLVIASRAHRNDIDDLDIKSRSVTQQVLKAEDGATHATHSRDSTATAALLTFNCPNAAIVDACTKALVKYALVSVDRARTNTAPALAADFVPLLFGSLVSALRDTNDLPSGSIGAAQKKLAVHKQILKLVVKAGNSLTTVDPSFGAGVVGLDPSQSSPPAAVKGGRNSGKKGAATTTTTTTSVAAIPSSQRGLTQGQREILAKEISAMMLVSGEDQDVVRREAAKALKRYVVSTITKGAVLSGAPGADARHVAMLLMTAVLEGSRGGYNDLKSLVQEVHERMIAVRATVSASISAAAGEPQTVQLGDHRAPRLFLEYAVPPLVLYMAHHPFFDEEKQGGTSTQYQGDDGSASGAAAIDQPATPFKTFMRAWHLLFEELFQADTQPAAAVHEMFRKLRQLDDAIAKPKYEDATRIICDLGAKTMLAVLEDKSTSTSSHHQYPGALLIPNYFRVPQDPSQFPADRVYLPRNCVISSHPVFGLPVGALSSASIAPSMSRTPARMGAGASSQSRARSNSTAPPTTTKYRAATTTTTMAVAEEDDDNADSIMAHTTSRTPLGSPLPKVATGQKRSRVEPPVAGAVDADALLTSAPNEMVKPRGGTVRKRLKMQEEAAAVAVPPPAESGRKSVALPRSEDDTLTLEMRRTIMGVVHGLTSGKSADQLDGITFRMVKEAISSALGGRVASDAEKLYAKDCLRTALTAMEQS